MLYYDPLTSTTYFDDSFTSTVFEDDCPSETSGFVLLEEHLLSSLTFNLAGCVSFSYDSPVSMPHRTDSDTESEPNSPRPLQSARPPNLHCQKSSARRTRTASAAMANETSVTGPAVRTPKPNARYINSCVAVVSPAGPVVEGDVIVPAFLNGQPDPHSPKSTTDLAPAISPAVPTGIKGEVTGTAISSAKPKARSPKRTTRRTRTVSPASSIKSEVTSPSRSPQNIQASEARRKKPANYACDFCESKYTAAFRLKEHRKVHLGIKDHHCSYCSFETFYKDDVKRHMRTCSAKMASNGLYH